MSRTLLLTRIAGIRNHLEDRSVFIAGQNHFVPRFRMSMPVHQPKIRNVIPQAPTSKSSEGLLPDYPTINIRQFLNYV